MRLLILTLLWLPAALAANDRGAKTPPVVRLRVEPTTTATTPEIAAKAPVAGKGVTAAATAIPLSAVTGERAVFGQRIAAPVSPTAEAQQGTSHPLIQHAQEIADGLGGIKVLSGVDEGLASLRSMRTQGFAFVPREAVVRPEEFKAINAQIDTNHSAVSTWVLYNPPGRWTTRANPDDPHARLIPDNGGELRPVIDRLTHLLRSAMPSENLVLRDAQLRRSYEDNPSIHIDGGGYVTVTLALRGPGTLVYRVEKDGRVEELQAPLGSAAVITNVERHHAMGIEGTLHSAPTQRFFKPGEERRVLILRYYRAGQAKATEAESKLLTARNAPRLGAANAYRAKREGRAGHPPPRSFLKGLFGLE